MSAELLGVMGETWWTPSRLSVELREAPKATRARLQRLHLRGEVRYSPEGDRYQCYPVRGAVLAWIQAHHDREYNAAAVAEALPELGLTWAQMHALLADLAREGEIEVWFTHDGSRA